MSKAALLSLLRFIIFASTVLSAVATLLLLNGNQGNGPDDAWARYGQGIAILFVVPLTLILLFFSWLVFPKHSRPRGHKPYQIRQRQTQPRLVSVVPSLHDESSVPHAERDIPI